MSRTEILISGFGGQGVIRIGQTLGLAGVLSGLHATMLKSHGTETRGGYVRAQVVISDEEIDSPVTDNPEIFIAMSKAAYQRFYNTVPQHGIIVYDPAYVQPDESYPAKQIAVPARDLAVENFGKELYANMIIFGKIIKLLDGKIDRQTAQNALKQIIPRFIDDNLKAFDIGFGE